MPESERWCQQCGNVIGQECRTENVIVSGIGYRTATELWCETCVENRALFCEHSHRYYCRRRYSFADHPSGDGMFCTNSDHPYYFWESDDSYHYDPEPEEDEDGGGVDDYHGSDRDWNASRLHESAIGVELELYASERSRVASIARSYGFLAERDGSLDDYHGIEVIGYPMPFSHYKNDCSWHKFIRECCNLGGVKGWSAGTGYGIHVNLNRRRMTPLHCGKIAKFIGDHPAAVQVIAGRDSTSYARVIKKETCKPVAETKYEAVNLQSNSRLEVRVFRSTLKWDSFLKNVQFCDAVRLFCKDAGMNGMTWSAFCNFVAGAQSRYSQLAKFMMDRGIYAI